MVGRSKLPARTRTYAPQMSSWMTTVPVVRRSCWLLTCDTHIQRAPPTTSAASSDFKDAFPTLLIPQKYATGTVGNCMNRGAMQRGSWHVLSCCSRRDEQTVNTSNSTAGQVVPARKRSERVSTRSISHEQPRRPTNQSTRIQSAVARCNATHPWAGKPDE